MTLAFQHLPPLGLYVHLPWCEQKCPYCDFNSHPLYGQLAEQQYAEALIADLEQELPLIWGRSISTIFFGGGTPSLFHADTINSLLNAFRARLNLHPDLEVTLEANPGSAEAEKFAGFRQAGVTRLSLGIQSFNDDHLQSLGRIHDAGQARHAINDALAAGFEHINLDLMFGLPNQSENQAITDITIALRYPVDHISSYQLTLEPNTPFAHSPPPLPDDDTKWAMQAAIADHLEQAGFSQYEVSAYCLPGNECRHNLNYWQFGDYIGIGAGAHGKLTFHDRVERRIRARHPKDYMAKTGTPGVIVDSHRVNRESLIFEFLLNQLRLKQGFAEQRFFERTATPFGVIRKKMQSWQDRGLLTLARGQVTTTTQGFRFIDEILQDFLPEGSKTTT